MKTYTIEEIIRKVRVKLDEGNVNESEMIGDYDKENLDNIIRENIGAAYRFVVTHADQSMLEGRQLSGAALTIDEDRIGHLKLPNNFLRGVSVRLRSWNSSPARFIEESSPEYRMQADPYACGSYQEPVAALVNTSSGRYLELYKAKDTDDGLKSFEYLTIWDETAEDISIPDMLVEPLIYYNAGLTANVLKDESATAYLQTAEALVKNG